MPCVREGCAKVPFCICVFRSGRLPQNIFDFPPVDTGPHQTTPITPTTPTTRPPQPPRPPNHPNQPKHWTHQTIHPDPPSPNWSHQNGQTKKHTPKWSRTTCQSQAHKLRSYASLKHCPQRVSSVEQLAQLKLTINTTIGKLQSRGPNSRNLVLVAVEFCISDPKIEQEILSTMLNSG